ncbi:MAG TPA: MFS transporter [Candidatus Dormibacteraeota bacterium]
MSDRHHVAGSAEGSWRSIVRGPQGRLTVGLSLLTLAVATESLVITTIMPAIVQDIGGLALYGLAFSGFFLAGLAAIPTAGWALDRYGPARPFAVLMAIFLLATLAAALAPNMIVLVGARCLQGYGATAQFTISQGTIARAYPVAARVKVLSLLSATWTLPALFGPSVGALITAAVGWRWAFAAVLGPAILAAAITFPSLRAVASPVPSSRPPALTRPFQLALGAGMFITGLTTPTWWVVPVLVAGLVLMVRALRQILPAGFMRARPGLPAIITAGFFLNFGIYTAFSFVALVLTGLRGVSLGVAAIGVSAAILTWTMGVWINTVLVSRVAGNVLIASAAALLAAGIVGFGTAIYDAPLAVPFIAWALAGVGMGIAFNTLTLKTMSAASAGSEGMALASRNLMGSLGTALGTGIGGAIVAASQALHLGLRPGLAAIYGLAAASAIATAALAMRAAGKLPAHATVPNESKAERNAAHPDPSPQTGGDSLRR